MPSRLSAGGFCIIMEEKRVAVHPAFTELLPNDSRAGVQWRLALSRNMSRDVCSELACVREDGTRFSESDLTWPRLKRPIGDL